MWVQKIGGGGVAALAYAPDGRTLYAVDRGEWLTVWDTATRAGKRLATLGPPAYSTNALRWLPGGRLAAATRSSVRVWDTSTGRTLLDTERPDLALWLGSAITTDGRLLAITRDRDVLATVDLSTGRPGPMYPLPNPELACYGFDVHPDGRSVAVAFRNGPVTVFECDPTVGALRNPVELEGTSGAYTVLYSPDGGALAMWSVFQKGLHQARFWDVAEGRFRGDPVPCSLSALQFAFNPVFPVFASCRSEGGGLALWRSDTLELLRSLDFDIGRRARCVSFAPDGLTCAVGGSNKQFAVFDVDV